MSKAVNVSVNIGLSDRDHALQRPEVNIGSVTSVEQNKVYLDRDGSLKYGPVFYNPGLVHLLLEIVSNASDNSAKNGDTAELRQALSRVRRNTEKYQSICLNSNVLITVTLTPQSMSVVNYGAPFDIDFAGDGMFIPERCFLETQFGSNFNDDGSPRIGTGRNGIGAKLAVFFSKQFELECVDYERKRYFKMTLTHNGDSRSKRIRVWPEPNGKMFDGIGYQPPNDILAIFENAKRSYTSVSWIPDSEEGNLTDITPFTRTLVNNDIVIIRCSGGGVSEEVRTTVREAGLDPVLMSSDKRCFRMSQIGNMRHVRCVRTGLSLPETACIFRGGNWISDAEINLAARHCVDFTLCDVPLLIRRKWSDGAYAEKVFFPMTVQEYGAMLFPNIHSFTHSWTNKDGTISCQIAYFDTPNSGIQIGFVNGVFADTGIHMKAANSALWDKLHAQEEIKKFAPTATVADFRKHVTTVVLCIGLNPKQEGQTKSGLSSISGKGSISISDIDPAVAQKMVTGSTMWNSMKLLMEDGLNKELELLKANMRKIKAKNFVPANIEGPNSILAYSEGDSAAGYVDVLKNLQEHSDRIGVFPGRGVPKNLYEADIREAISNTPFATFIKVCNLDEKKTYETPEELATLKYGKWIFFGDADLDGYHIIGLMIANMWNFWPNLFYQRRVGMFRTPVVRIFEPGSKGPNSAIKARYYSDREYEEAVKNGTAPAGRVKRLKGLGSVNIGSLEKPGPELVDDYNFGRVVWFNVDDEGKIALNAFFSSHNAPIRRQAITTFAKQCNEKEGEFYDNNQCNLESFGPSTIQTRQVSNYVLKEIIQYSIGSLYRQIPSASDGLKDAQRKILAYFLEHSNFGSKFSLEKVETLVGKVAEKQDYHHGAEILGTTLKRMTVQGFCGANNVSPFVGDGNFGLKMNWPNDAAANRYPFVGPAPWLSKAFRRNVYNSVPRIISNGEEIEPKWLPCVIPFAIMNGITGIGSGWSTYHPPCHPTTVLSYLCEWAEAKLQQRHRNHVEVLPWYIGFRGKMSIVKDFAAMAVVEDESEEVEQKYEYTKAIRMTGLWSIEEPRQRHANIVAVLRIIEVPPEVRLNRVIEILTDLKDDGFVHSFQSDTKKGIDFKINLTNTGLAEYNNGQLIKKLKLVETYSMSNFNMLDEYGAPRKFIDIYQYLNFFMDNIISVYEVSKRREIDALLQDLAGLNSKYRYIESCIKGIIEIGKFSRSQMLAKLAELNIEHKSIVNIDPLDINEEGLQHYRDLVDKKIESIKKLENTNSVEIYYNHLKELIPHIPTCPLPTKISDIEWVSSEK